MLFTRVTSFLLAFATFGLVAFSKPVQVLKRDTSDIESILSTLQGTTASVLPQISLLGSSGNATNANVAPLINELVIALNSAAANLNFAGAGSGGLLKRQSTDALEGVVSGIISEITDALGTLLGSAVTELDFLLSTVDVALNQVLGILGDLVEGLLTAVAALLGTVIQTLETLAFDLVLGLLGLLSGL